MSLRVRQIDRREWLLAQTATECQRHGREATLEYPTRQGMWVRLSDAEKRWSAWIQHGDWRACLSRSGWGGGFCWR